MARVILTLLGLITLGLGVWATIAWWDAVKIALLALVAIGLLLLGVALLIFGVGELMGARPPKAAGPTEQE